MLARRPAITKAASIAAIAILGTTATIARAEPVVVPPKPASKAEVPYPEGASGDAAVVLILTIDKEGAVTAAEVERGDEPFASAARAAALGWRFSPATLDGKPRASRIRFAIDFLGPREVPLPAAPIGSAPPRDNASPPDPAAPPRAIEVTVRAEKPPPSVVSLSRAEVRQLPGTFGDPFRAIEVLPGVTPIVSGLPFFYVRGAPPGNVGYFLDGVRVPYLYHVTIGPSIVNPAMVERVDLYSGGYPARFGRFAGAIVAAETTEPRASLHGEGNLRVFDAGAMIEGGFANGRGTALVGGRYSYTAAIFSLVSPTLTLDYRDYQARVTFDVTPRDRLTLFAFGSYDLLAEEKNGITSTVFGSELYRVDLRYDRKLEGGGLLRWAATWGFDQTRIGEQRNARDVIFGTRLELIEPIAQGLTARGGIDAQFDTYAADPRKWADPDDPSTKAYDALFPPRTDAVMGAWGDLVWQMSRKVELTPGVRFDLFRSGGASQVAIDGRVALRAEVHDRVQLVSAVGIAHQPPSFLVSLPGLAMGSLDGGLQRSLQASSGVMVKLPLSMVASVTLFDDVFLNMSDAPSLGALDDPTAKLPRSLGSAYGVEVYLRKRMSHHVGGFLSYTLSRSTRKIDIFDLPSVFDRTHVFNAALAFDLTHGFGAGARLTVYTGVPSWNALATISLASIAHPPRDPTFYRLDLRAEKRWDLKKSRWISVVAEMLNTTMNKESLNGEEIGPIFIPSLGMEGGF